MKENKIVRYDRTKNAGILSLTQEYEAKEFKEIWTKTQAQLNMHEKQLKEANKQVEALPKIENKKELEELKGKLMQLQQLDEMTKIEGQVTYLKERIKNFKEEILLLEPVMKQMPKK